MRASRCRAPRLLILRRCCDEPLLGHAAREALPRYRDELRGTLVLVVPPSVRKVSCIMKVWLTDTLPL